MANHILPESPHVLLQVAQKYQNEQQQPKALDKELFFHHEKNPDAVAQILFLETMFEHINTRVNPKERNFAVLGTLLLFKGLLTDPNQEGEIYDYLVEKLDLDKEITQILHSLKPGVEQDYLDPQYLILSRNALEFCRQMIESPELKAKFSDNFMKELRGTLVTDIDYVERVDYTLEGFPQPKRPS